MAIKVAAPNGAEIEFPDGTDAQTIQRVMGEFMQKGPPQAQLKPEVSRLESAGRGAVQGLTFGFGDEIYGGVKGAANYLMGDGDFSQTYARERDAVRAANKQAQEANPGTYLAGEVGGSLVVPGGLARTGVTKATGAAASKVLPAAVTESRIGNAALQGAGYGAAYGAGTSEGKTAGEVATDTATGAAIGGAFGAAVPPVVDAVSAVGRAVTAPIRAVANPGGTAATKYAERVAQDFGASKTPEAIQDAATRYAARAANYADDATMMNVDLAGENTRRLVRQANNMPNDAVQGFQTKLARRQVTAPNRLVDAVEETLAPGGNFYEAVDRIVERRSGQAKKLFEAAYDAPFNVKANDDLARFLTERDYVRKLVQNTAENVKGMTGEDVMQMKPWEMLHRVRMQIDKEIGQLKRGQNTSGWDMNDLLGLKREFSTLLERSNPDLGKAIKAYADKSALKNALEEGMEDFAKLAPEELAKKVTGLRQSMFDDGSKSPFRDWGIGSEAEMYRMGAARALIDQIRKGNASNDRTKSVFGSPDMQLRLKAIFPDGKERGQFLKVVQAERLKNRTNAKVMGGSMTDQNLQNAGEVMAPVQAVNAITNAASGRLQPALEWAGRQANRFTGMTPGVAEETLKIASRKPSQGVDPRVLEAFDKASRSARNRDEMIQAIIAAAAAAANQ